MVRHPDTDVVRDAIRASSPPSALSWWRRCERHHDLPGYPVEMAFFTRALARVGATVIGVGDQPPDALPPAAREGLAHYERVSPERRGAVLRALSGLAAYARFDLVECLWEPYMLLAAHLREAFGLPGMTVDQTVPFRDKERMKQQIDAAGIRTPRHVSTTTVSGVWEAAEWIGFPLIVKPIAGGSADTYRVGSVAELNDVLPLLRHVLESASRSSSTARSSRTTPCAPPGRSCSSTCCGTGHVRCRCGCTSGSARAASAARPVGARPASRSPDGSRRA